MEVNAIDTLMHHDGEGIKIEGVNAIIIHRSKSEMVKELK